MKISTILDKIDENQLFVPAFQREYVWKRDDAKQLIDSLIKEYPTGTMLTWETSNPPELKGPHRYSSSQGSVKLLLDGQQRVTTLYMLIKGEIPPYYSQEDILHPINGLYVNLETLELNYYQQTRMAENPLWQDITDIFKRNARARVIVKELTEHGREVDEILADTIDDNIRAIENISDREFPEQVIPVRASIREAIDIFYKVNASGVALTDAELALAQISGYWPEARDVLKKKLAELAKEGFVFRLDFMVYALLGCMYQMGSDMKKLHGSENLEPQYNEAGELTRDGITTAWEKLDKYVLDYVVNLLRSRAFVDHTKEINSIYALIPIIVFVYLNQGKTIEDQQLSRIVKWFYYSQIRVRYVNQLPQKLDFDLRIVRDSERPFEELIGVINETRRLEITPEEFVGRSISHPLFALVKWYLKQKGATCLTTGLRLHQNMGEKYQLEHDHIFPWSALRDAGYGRDNRQLYSLAQELTNRAILTQVANRKKSAESAENYLAEVSQKSPHALEKQCIPSDPELWKLENYEHFLDVRRQTLAKELNEYLEGLASERIEDYGSATLVEIIAEGESSGLEFKSSLRWGSSEHGEIQRAQAIIMKTIAGFANADGGTLLLGVQDDGTICGLEPDYVSLGGDRDKFELHLGALIDNSFTKIFRAKNVKISFPEVNGIEICMVEISKASEPQILKLKDKHGAPIEKFYLRTGNATQELTLSEASDYLK